MGLETVDESCVMRSRQVAPLSIALPKGRLLRPSLGILRGIGLTCPDVDGLDRRLVYETADSSVRFIIARPADVPAYVEHGAADLGITGKDVLLEGDWNVCEMLDLGFGQCRMAVAAPAAATGPDPAAALSGPRLPRLGHPAGAASSAGWALLAPGGICAFVIVERGREIAPIVACRCDRDNSRYRSHGRNGLAVVEG